MAKEREELLEASLQLIESKKIASKALKDVTKRILANDGTTKENWVQLRKLFAKMGCGWSGDPLTLQEDAEKKDTISVMLVRLLNVIGAFEEFNMEDKILPYFTALKEYGITIMIDPAKFAHAEIKQEDAEEALQQSKSWIDTIDQNNDILKTEHAPKSEELNFTLAPDYGKVLSLYNRKLKGKDIDDKVQDILTRNELLDTAVNLVNDLQVD